MNISLIDCIAFLFLYRFKNTARYTMIIGADVNGFVEETCQLFHRDEVLDKGAAGTVNRDCFKGWVREFLVPNLGNFEKGEKRSIVIMDNASTHMDIEVGDMIREAGAVLLYTAPYSPDLNPIKNMFNIYKSNLKRNEEGFEANPIKAHWNAVHAVSRDSAIKEFRHCSVPFSNMVQTIEEEEKEALIGLNNAMTVAVISKLFNYVMK